VGFLRKLNGVKGKAVKRHDERLSKTGGLNYNELRGSRTQRPNSTVSVKKGTPKFPMGKKSRKKLKGNVRSRLQKSRATAPGLFRESRPPKKATRHSPCKRTPGLKAAKRKAKESEGQPPSVSCRTASQVSGENRQGENGHPPPSHASFVTKNVETQT